MLVYSVSRHYSKLSSGLLVVWLVLVLTSSQGLVYGLRQNILTLQIFQSGQTILLKAPWVNGLWWESLCEDSMVSDVGDTNASSFYRDAIRAIAQNKCEQATSYLSRIGITSPNAPNNIMLAYTYSMRGRWSEAASVFPISQITPTNWSVRRYWGNVLLRAGTAPGADPALLLEAEQLFDVFRPDGSLALAHFWQTHHDPVAAFEEFRRALVNLDDPAALALVGEYELLRRDYVAAMAARQPADAAWQHLALKYQLSDGTHVEAGLEPLYALDYSLPDGRRLVGLTPDTDGLALGPLVRVTLYFREADAPATETRWVRNRMPDAGFAWSAPVAGVRPFGYGAQYGIRPPYPLQIERASDQQYICLDHATNSNSGLLSPPLSASSSLMIVAGKYRTENGGKATLGVRWFVSDEATFRHLSSGRASAQWQSVVGVVAVPPQAERISGYMLQYQSVGRACFDDVLLFSLDLAS